MDRMSRVGPRVGGIDQAADTHSWNTLKTYENILNELGADVICFQGRHAPVYNSSTPRTHLHHYYFRIETKITKKQVTRDMAILPSFDSFFSSYSRKPEKGYSGTCIFTRRSVTIPLKAEEGISGLLPLERRPEPSEQDLIGGTLGPDSIALNMQDVRTIDLEGRITMVDLGLFVLINVYCPNETNEERLDFKLAFNAMLEARILNLIRLGREVIVLGDLNICRLPIDHCDPIRRMKDSSYANFGDHPARKWLNDFVAPGTGVMVDLGRHFNPDRKSMFTHWETRINARETNYGTRIDFILSTPGLLPWIKNCDIQPQIIGSDHCPVIADFHESIINEKGETEYLWDKVNPPGRSKDPNAIPPEPPKLAAKFYPEFGAEQRLLSNFFKKPSASIPASMTTTATSSKESSSGISKPPPSSVLPVASSSTSKTPAPLAPIPSSLLADGSASTSKQPIVDVPRATPSSSHSTGGTHTATSSQGALASPSIDLTLDESDENTSAANGKNTARISQKSDRKTQISSSVSSPIPSNSNGTKKSITKPKGKKGQQTLATFFKPPTPVPEVISTSSKKSKKLSKGKERASDEPVVPPNTLTDSRRNNVDEAVISSSDDDSANDVINEDDELKDLKRKADKGSRVLSSSEKPPNSHKKRKSWDVSRDGSTDSDMQDVGQTTQRVSVTHADGLTCGFDLYR